LTNHITDIDMLEGAQSYPDPQDWAANLVQTALGRGSKDNVTCVVVAFDQA
jgi:serine/threonine protein phosphatase PrpC